VRDRHRSRLLRAQGRRGADPEVLHPQRRARLRQDRDLHAQAPGGRQRLRHARHQSLSKGGKNLFAGDGYAGLSDIALWYIGGIIKHARAINAFTNPGTNSYKRLVPGYEAPVMLAYSARNRSASIRIPAVSSPKARRIEVRFPDPSSNPYLGFAAMLMAWSRRHQEPHPPRRSARQEPLRPAAGGGQAGADRVRQPRSRAGHAERGSLVPDRGRVFDDDMIDAYIELKQVEIDRLRMTTHPIEFEMYYSC
jgi:glutamine synthetase